MKQTTKCLSSFSSICGGGKITTRHNDDVRTGTKGHSIVAHERVWSMIMKQATKRKYDNSLRLNTSLRWTGNTKKKLREALPKKQLTEALSHSHTSTHMHSNMLHGKSNRHMYDLLASQGSALRVYDICTDHSVAIIERNPMKAHWTKLPIQHARCMRQQIPCTVREIYDTNGALHFIDTLRMIEFGHYRSCAKFHSLPLYRNFKARIVLRKM